MDRESLKAKTVVQLRALSKKKGISSTGKKDELITKILASTKKKVPKTKIEKSKSKSKKVVSVKSVKSGKMEIVTTTAKNGQIMYFHVIDGKKKRISAEAAKGVKPKGAPKEKAVAPSETKEKSPKLQGVKANLTQKFIDRITLKVEGGGVYSDKNIFILRSARLDEITKGKIPHANNEKELRMILNALPKAQKEAFYARPFPSDVYLAASLGRLVKDGEGYVNPEAPVLVIRYETNDRVHNVFSESDDESFERINLMASWGIGYPIIRYEVTTPDGQETVYSQREIRWDNQKVDEMVREFPRYVDQFLDALEIITQKGYHVKNELSSVWFSEGNIGFNQYGYFEKSVEKPYISVGYIFTRVMQEIDSGITTKSNLKLRLDVGDRMLKWLEKHPGMIDPGEDLAEAFSWPAFEKDPKIWKIFSSNPSSKTWKKFGDELTKNNKFK